MASTSFHFRLVSPEAEIMSGEALSVSASGTDGDFGALPRHMPFITSLRPGVVTAVMEDNPNPVRYFITGGFADVNPASVTVLAEQATDVLQINAAAVAAEVAALEARLKDPMDEVQHAAITAELSIARAKLKAAA